MALYTTLDENLARLTRREKIPTIAGDSLDRRWEYIDATVADDLVTAVTGTTIATPKADKQTYTGTFARGNIRADGQGDKSVTISETLTLITTLTSDIADLHALLPTATYDNEILNNFGLHEGEKDAVAFVYSNLDPAGGTKAACLGYSDDAISATLGLSNGTYLRRRFEYGEDGTATFTIVAEEPVWTNTWAGKIQMQQQSAGGYRVKEINEATGINDDDYAQAVTDAKVASGATRNVQMVQLIERANGERVVSQVEASISTGTTTPDLFLEIQEAVGNRENQAGRVWWRRTAAAKTTLTTLASGAAASDFVDDNARTYTHLKYEVTDNGDGSYNVFQMGVIPNSTSSGYRGLKDGTVAPVSLSGITIKNKSFETLESFIIIVDRIVTSTYATARDFADDSDDHSDGHRLGSVTWDDRNQRWIGLKEQWYNAFTTPPIADNNYTTVTDSVPVRRINP